MKKRERAGKGDRGGARKSEAQTAHFIRDMEEQTPFAYAFVKSQNRNMYRRMMQYKRELDAERSALARASLRRLPRRHGPVVGRRRVAPPPRRDAGAAEAAVRDADQRRAAAEHAAASPGPGGAARVGGHRPQEAARRRERADLGARAQDHPYPEKLAAQSAPAPEPDAKRARTEAAAAPPAAPAAGGAAAEEAAARVADLEEQVSGAFETRIQLKMAVDAGAALSDAEARAKRFAGDRDANAADRDAAAGDADRSRRRRRGAGRARDALGEWAEKLEATAAARRSAEEARDAAAARADAAALAADGLRKALELEAAARREAIVAAPPPEEGEVDDDQATAGATNEGLRMRAKRTEEVNRSLLEEVDATATTFTDLRDQNKRLLDRAGALDACYRATPGRRGASAAREVAARDALKAKVDHTEYVVNEMKQLLNARSTVAEDLEREHGLAVANAAAATSEVGHLKGQLAAARLEQDAAARDLDVARGQLKRFHEDLSAKLADETTAKARVQDQLKAMERKHTKLEGQLSRSVDDLRKEKHRNGAGTDEISRSTIRDLREKIACNVCNDREKTTCLTRCMHVFCRECVDQVIETRSRKCPACHKPFGASDVKEIYFCA
ncbi:hypothetical protein JL722_1404 [Aureococcus anophagefferens]|nr:hypothetical protein JL722_1404 [Aureococcus anophagefferens]